MKSKLANTTYEKTEQPTIASRIDNRSVIYMIRRTNPDRQIHIQTETWMQEISRQWIQTWEDTTKQIAQTTQRTQKPTNCEQTIPYIIGIRNRYTQKISQETQELQKPPGLYDLKHQETHRLTDVMLKINTPKKKNRARAKKLRSKNNT